MKTKFGLIIVLAAWPLCCQRKEYKATHIRRIHIVSDQDYASVKLRFQERLDDAQLEEFTSTIDVSKGDQTYTVLDIKRAASVGGAAHPEQKAQQQGSDATFTCESQSIKFIDVPSAVHICCQPPATFALSQAACAAPFADFP